MADYWHSRYLQTLSNIAEAKCPKVRSAYMDLAAHYSAMRQFCERGVAADVYRTAA